MAASNNKNLTADDLLAALGQETGNRLMDAAIRMTEEVEDSSPETGRENPADFPEGRVLDEASPEDTAGPMIILDANLTIQHVVTLYEKLKKSYSAHNAIEINASQVSSIDTSTLQLLVALKKNAVKQQKEVTFVAPSRRFIESAGLLGLLDILNIDS